MTKVDRDFIRKVQLVGWQILDVTEDKVRVVCPRAGCTLKVKLSPEGELPTPCGSGIETREKVVAGFDDAREFLRDRRESLALAIKDVEECAGMTPDFLAKFEKDNPSKIPNVMTFLDWAQTLGFDVVLRPSVLPTVTAARIADTRSKRGRRLSRYQVDRARRRGER